MKNKTKKKLPHTLERKDGIYAVFNYKDANGKYKRVEQKLHQVTVEAVAEARKSLAYLVELKTNQQQTGFYQGKDELTFQAVAERWLKVKSHIVRIETLTNYKHAVNFYFRRLLDKNFTSITPLDLQNLIDDVSLRHGKSGVFNARKPLSGIYSFAVKQDLIEKNPLKKVTFPIYKAKESLAMTLEETKQFLSHCDDSPINLAFQLQLFTGMRPSEICGLRWQDINFDKGFLQIRQAYSKRIDGTYIFKPPKNAKSKRSIPLSTELVQKLQNLKDGSPKNEWNLVFTIKDRPVRVYRYGVRLKQVFTRAKLNSKFNAYTLRHTTATLLLFAGENPKVLADRMGHSVEMLFKVYAHSGFSEQVDISRRMEELLK